MGAKCRVAARASAVLVLGVAATAALCLGATRGRPDGSWRWARAQGLPRELPTADAAPARALDARGGSELGVGTAIRVYAAHPWALASGDEAVALANVGEGAASLAGWGLSDGDMVADALLPDVGLAPGEVVWIAEDAEAFRQAFGYSPGLALRNAPDDGRALSGTWPGYANEGDQVVLHDREGVVVDLVVYGRAAALSGWQGPAVAYPTAGFGDAGQVLHRKLDEGSGLPVPDTDQSLDWMGDRACGQVLYGPVCEGDLFGKRVVYPGWDWGLVTDTLEITSTSSLTVGVAPDNAYAVVADLLSRAETEILIEAYSLESVWLTEILTQRIAAGVVVTVLLDGGAISGEGLWNSSQIARAGGEVYYMHNDPGAAIHDRYRSQHAKFILVDRRQLAVSTENLGNRGMPVDDKANGTAGSRGVVLVTDEERAVAYVASLFARDCDPQRHVDIVPYGSLPRYTVPVTYTPVYSTGGGGYIYMAPFSMTQPAFTAEHLEVLHAPETSLRYADGLIGLLLRAGPGDEVYVEQMYERLHWGTGTSGPGIDPNPRLEAYVEAARRGARVRILLDNGLDRERLNYGTAFYLLQVSVAEGLDLEVRLGDPTLSGLHNKMVLVQVGAERYVHAGSINGSEVSSKVNRELALQVRSPDAYAYLREVWGYDWAHSRAPHEQYLPVVCRRYVAAADHVLISEFLFREAGAGEDLGEWIELHNPTSRRIGIGGWSLGDAVHAQDYERNYAFPTGSAIEAGGTLVIARQAAAFQATGYASRSVPDFEWQDSNAVPNLLPTSWGDGECALGNSGDEILLRDALGRVVDAVTYGAGSLPGVDPFRDVDAVYNGNSLERWPANRDSDDCSFDFRVRYAPDPGNVVAW